MTVGGTLPQNFNTPVVSKYALGLNICWAVLGLQLYPKKLIAWAQAVLDNGFRTDSSSNGVAE